MFSSGRNWGAGHGYAAMPSSPGSMLLYLSAHEQRMAVGSHILSGKSSNVRQVGQGDISSRQGQGNANNSCMSSSSRYLLPCFHSPQPTATLPMSSQKCRCKSPAHVPIPGSELMQTGGAHHSHRISRSMPTPSKRIVKLSADLSQCRDLPPAHHARDPVAGGSSAALPTRTRSATPPSQRCPGLLLPCSHGCHFVLGEHPPLTGAGVRHCPAKPTGSHLHLHPHQRQCS